MESSDIDPKRRHPPELLDRNVQDAIDDSLQVTSPRV